MFEMVVIKSLSLKSIHFTYVIATMLTKCLMN